MAESRAAAIDAKIVDWEANIEVRHATHRLVTGEGGDLIQRYRFLLPAMSVTAHADGDTQTRTLHGYRGICQQGGDEILARFGFAGSARRIAEEALELLAAPNCPTGTMDVLLMPDQMILQIHESIGHPLELDRILGDERNFAGTSFVTPDMFGTYRYGSDLLNVTFDPTRTEELASYGWDDDGTKAREGPSDPQRHPRAAAGRRDLAGARGAPRHVERARRRLEPAADRPDGEPEPRARRRDAGRDDRGHRARRADGDQLLVVDRRLAQQVPVRLRARAPDRERPARRRRQESELPRDQRELLAQPRARRQRRHRCRCWGRRTAARASRARRSAWATRRRRACSATSPCLAGRRRCRRARTPLPAATMESYFRDVAATLDGLVQAGETYTAWFSAECLRFRPDEPRQGAPARQRRPALSRPRPDPRRAARDATSSRSRATPPWTAPRSRRRSRPRAPRSPMPRTTRTC